MSGLNVMHCTPGDLGKLPEWRKIIPYAATLGEKKLESGRPVFNMIWISPFCQTTDAFTHNKHPRQGSLYATRDHFRVDSLFSTVPDGHRDKRIIDERHLRALCDQGAKHGIRLCADLVINHVASDHKLVVREDSDVNAIRQWGKDIRVLVKSSESLVEREQGTVAPGESVIAITYRDGEHNTLPGEFLEKGRKIYDLRFAYDGMLEPIVDSSLGQNWADARKINYRNDKVRGEFIDLWKEQISWLLGLGFTGFRCDAAYKIGRQVWSELVQHAYDDHDTRDDGPVKAAFSEPLWIAETLGGDWTQIRDNLGAASVLTRDGRRKAFDYGMLGTHWWNGQDASYIDQSHVLRQNTRFGGLGVADNHDTPETLAAAFMRQCRPEAVSDICFRDFVQSLVLGAGGVCMERGFENCLEEQASIFREPDVFARRRRTMRERTAPDHPLNLNRRLWAVMNYLDQIRDMGLTPVFDRDDFATSLGKNNNLMRYTLGLTENHTGEKLATMTVIVHARPEEGYDLIDKKVLNMDDTHVQRLVLGSGDTEQNFLKVHDVAIYTDLHAPNIAPDKSVSVRNLPERALALEYNNS